MQAIGRYQVTNELGKGAMGVVYKALDPTIGREVALKTMRLDVSGMESEELLRRFRNEARAAGVLNHSNIVTIYDAGEHEGLFYIAMECIQGQTLQSLLAEQHVLPVEQLIDITRQVCAGLDYAHARNIIHRDIKPANIMRTPDGTVKIMDFGIAKSGGGITSPGQVLGTPNYMSPEQVKGKPLDGRSDLFSVGVMMYEMLTGEKPFDGQSITTIMYKIVNETPIQPRDLDVTVHPGLNAVVTRALAKSPDERYQTGAELARDLQNYKSIGASDEATVAFDAPTVGAAAFGVSSVGAGAAPARAPVESPAPVRVPTVRSPAATAPLPAPQTPPRPRTSMTNVILGLVLLALAALGAGYYRHVSTQRNQPLVSSAPPVQVEKPASPELKPEKPEQKEEIKTEPVALDLPGQAKPVAKSTTGELRLVSTPPGASVQIDGRADPNWITPVTLPHLRPGSHTLTLSKADYVSKIQVADVTSGRRTTVDVTLLSSRPVLVLTSQPPGAAIIVDGKPTAMSTPAEVPVDVGTHNIVLRKLGFEDAVSPARVSEGQRFTFAPKLQPNRDLTRLRRFLAGNKKGLPAGVPRPGEPRGGVQIRTQPPGAEIVINGFTVPKPTPFRFPLRPGQYDLTLRLEGYKPIHKKIDVVKDQLVQINELLERQ